MFRNGESVGESLVRRNNVMLGHYLDDESTSDATFDDGWLRTGDLGVMHNDGYIEIGDREKDIIVSGGENIDSVEIENALTAHPDGAGEQRLPRRHIQNGVKRRSNLWHAGRR
ncbi:hypothetical protein BS297_27205 [Rhodococcus erythropolis]|uniref:Uncharacterized protein n=1 Tax=Rhodococcus erythropolis TaxID=1833 RepID=A0A5N5DXB0_RHOER|nr:hypothetical protein BS297_27205 [Rhodococcus erythropolis]